MLKLMKYEFIHSMRTFVLSFTVFLAFCFIAPFAMNLKILSYVPMLFAFFAAGITFLFIGIIIALFVSIFINYYRSMFKKPGYLTMTLPVPTGELIISKIIMSMIWLVIGVIVLIIGICMFAFISEIMNDAMTVSDVMKIIMEIIKDLFDSLYKHPFLIFSDLLYGLACLLLNIAIIYFSLTVTHTKWVRKHRLLFSILLFFGLLFVIAYLLGVLFGEVYAISLLNLKSFSMLVMSAGLIFGTIYTLDHFIEIE